MNYWNKEKKRVAFGSDKKRINWNQSLRSKTSTGKTTKPKKIKKSLQYLLILKKFNNVVDYKNIKLLRAFLNKYGKIRPRRKTKMNVKKQKRISKAIRKSRAFGLIPFTCNVTI